MLFSLSCYYQFQLNFPIFEFMFKINAVFKSFDLLGMMSHKLNTVMLVHFYPHRNTLLRPNEVTQRDVLSGAIAELLWKVQKLHLLTWIYFPFPVWRQATGSSCCPRGQSCVWESYQLHLWWSHWKGADKIAHFPKSQWDISLVTFIPVYNRGRNKECYEEAHFFCK